MERNTTNSIKESIHAPFSMTEVIKNRLKISIEEDFRSKAWAAWFGQLQYALRNKIFNERNFESVQIDFSGCKWADPIPLLSLLLTLNEYKQNGGRIITILPDVPDNKKKYNESLRLLKFLAQEGFLKLFIDYSDKVKNGNSIINYDNIEYYSEITQRLFFVNCKLLPAEILDTKEIEDIEEWVDEKTVKFSHLLSNKVPNWVIDDLLTSVASSLN